MAVLDKIPGAERPQIVGAGVQNRYQVWIMTELRGKRNKIHVHYNFVSLKNLGGIVDIFTSLPSPPVLSRPETIIRNSMFSTKAVH